MAGRVGSVLLGLWLVFSAFLWEHGRAQFQNAWICGALVIVISLISIGGWRQARYGSVAISAWLFVSALLFPEDDYRTVVNHVLSSVFLLVLTLLPSGRPAPARP